MQTIGERLEEARKRKGISIREASEATKIRSDYLQKFESNTFEINLPDIYVRGFLRTYAQYLKLNSEKLLTDYASLGFGEPRDSRRGPGHQESREIIGRIDLPETTKPAALPPQPIPLAAEPVAQRTQSSSPRSIPTAVVTGAPSADRRQKVKLPLIVGGAVLALLILVLLVRALLPDSAPKTASGPASTTTATVDAPPQGDVIKLIALDNVQVKVTQLSDKQVLFSGDLIKGDTRYVKKDGRVSVAYNPGKNLQVEVKGQRFKMTVDGWGQNTIQ